MSASENIVPLKRTRRSVQVREAETVTARVITDLFQSKDTAVQKTEMAYKSYQAKSLVDPFVGIYLSAASTYAVMQPEYNPMELLKLPNQCSALRQCIDAMVTNIEAFGVRLEYIGEPNQEDSAAALAEKARIESLIEQPNTEYTYTVLRERIRRDLETFGYAFMEIVRDETQRITDMIHVPAQTCRMTAKEPTNVPVEQIVMRDGKLKKRRMTKRFRRFVQMVGSRLVYFKEFGDPRMINMRTGHADDNVPLEDSATEIFHFQLYSPGSPYGLPRWINNLPAVMGLRESELTNLDFFKQNAIPAMAVLVSGGALTNSSISNIQDNFTSGRGRESMNRVLVIEATGDDSASGLESTIPTPKLEIKTLASDRQTDGLFQVYEDSSEKKIRSSFRLPGLFVGRAAEYTRATADTSLIVADSQVFSPERNRLDEVWNSHFLTVDGMPLRFWRIRSNPPRLTNPEAIIDAIKILDKVGGLTPNVAIGLANELFDLALTPIEQEWGDYPFQIVLALAQTGNLAGTENLMIVVAPQIKGQLEGRNEPTKPVSGDTPASGDGGAGNPGDQSSPSSQPAAKAADPLEEGKKEVLEILQKRFQSVFETAGGQLKGVPVRKRTRKLS